MFSKYFYEKQGKINFFFKIEYLKAFFLLINLPVWYPKMNITFLYQKKCFESLCVVFWCVWLKKKPYQFIVANVFIFSFCINHCNKCKILIAFLFIFYFKTRCCVMYFFFSCCSLDIILIFTLSQIILYIYSINQINVYL